MPLQVRAIAYALKLANVSGAAALRFEEMIKEKASARLLIASDCF